MPGLTDGEFLAELMLIGFLQIRKANARAQLVFKFAIGRDGGEIQAADNAFDAGHDTGAFELLSIV